MANRQFPSAFLKSVLQNGVGRYVCQLQRLTFQFSKVHGTSRGVRDYIEEDIIDFARKNPQVVLYVTPHNKFSSPRIVAEFLNGTKRSVQLSTLDREEVSTQVDLLRTQSGNDLVRIRRPYHTDFPSIQGAWHPFANKPTNLNIAEFPTKEPTFAHPKTRRWDVLGREEMEDHLKEVIKQKESGS
ncbi:39S ribosomal protein L43, mitochondrial [Strongylocentrotus purpuratus]|uniref:Large ribosomal subunit protein mL43 n=1 Tax=Strongylocentrotus purpuratus TaxID=7668 RepID=A0A7M7RFW7_STRPU|nr:39S ribosomal protein L43, mitochondrial [Strongylocentrotus purpuratus]|eukprot:XP_791628.1 PREDICTED: 39S ribosomal protein L43, mitochondrial [Strongylocentrotus purpuratus]